MTNFQIDSTDLTWLARLARALLRESHAADDLVQDTVIAALESSPVPAPARRTWLAAVARRLAARRVRSESRRARREAAVAKHRDLPAAADLAARAEVAEQLAKAARSLPEPYRQTILLRFLEGHSPREIAVMVGRPTDTVRQRVRQGLQLLRDDLSRGSNRDWSSFSLLLLPLATPRKGAVVAASMTAPFTTWIAMKMKLLALVVVVGSLVGGGAWWLGSDTRQARTPDRTPATVALAGEPGATQSSVATSSKPSPLIRVPVEEPTAPAIPGNSLFGLVQNEAGAPVQGATVFLIATEDGTVLAKTRSSTTGAFRIAQGASTADLGVVANGYLRQFVTHAAPDSAPTEHRVILRHGARVAGRVIDELGRAVPDLELLAHTAGAAVDHVSPSQSQLRADKRALGNRKTAYEHCRARTDVGGGVTFSGLASGEVAVRSVDPGWVIKNPATVRTTEGLHVWTAERRLGVELTVVDVNTGRALERARATFHVELTMADGQEHDYGKWVGRGNGIVSFVLGRDMLPPLGDQAIISATFYGEAGSEHDVKSWRAKPIHGSMGAVGVARVRVEATAAPGPQAVQQPEQTTVELNVQYPDGSAFDGDVHVEWVALLSGGPPLSSDANPASYSPGCFRIQAPAGKLELAVQERNASGSLPAWRGEVFGYANRVVVAQVNLPQSARVSIPRPEGFDGEWFVHASWRPVGEAEWRGSWNYSTSNPTLQLNALRTAEWRFQLRPGSAAAPDPIVRVIDLRAGQRVTVDR